MHNKNIINLLKRNKNSISVEHFIDLSLNSKKGYYINSKVIGSQGDFITAPEISQLFGEIIGLYVFNFWSSKINNSFKLIELGPGKGTLLADILRITNSFNNFKRYSEIFLVEKNINLIKYQKIKLLRKNYTNKIKWLNDFEIKSKNPLIIIANEFFDCFPVQQFYKKNNTWKEKKIFFDNYDQCFKFEDIEITDIKSIEKLDEENQTNVLEISNLREKYFSKICKYLSQLGGLMIISDYGYIKKPSNFTLQSIYNNKKTNLFENIGLQDITSHVDFGKLINIANMYKLNIETYDTQRNFLLKNGIYERYKKILEKCDSSQKKIRKCGFDRILDINDMGSLFKFLIISKN